MWHPKGGAIRKEMEDYLREQLAQRGYGLVFTPHIAKRELWQTSGHEQNYADVMFAPTELEETQFRLKADELSVSYRDLQVGPAFLS